jgi:hypothetical protein
LEDIEAENDQKKAVVYAGPELRHHLQNVSCKIEKAVLKPQQHHRHNREIAGVLPTSFVQRQCAFLFSVATWAPFLWERIAAERAENAFRCEQYALQKLRLDCAHHLSKQDHFPKIVMDFEAENRLHAEDHQHTVEVHFLQKSWNSPSRQQEFSKLDPQFWEQISREEKAED